MDPVEQLSIRVRRRVAELGKEIIRFDQEKKSILASAELSEADKFGQTGAARGVLEEKISSMFGDSDGSIGYDIRQVLEAVEARSAEERERAQKAAGIWREELPGLRRFLEYCAGMIEEHRGEVSPEVRKSQKCLTEASVVLDQISHRVERELAA